ncbi:hypothetical protein D3C71_1408690 [compost metagenome]
MHHAAGRLYQYAVAAGAHREGHVGVFVIRRLVAQIEAADLLPQGARDHQRGAGAVVGIAQRAVARIFR